MPSVQYAHGTAFGTYYVDCEVIEKKNDTFLIKFLTTSKAITPSVGLKESHFISPNFLNMEQYR